MVFFTGRRPAQVDARLGSRLFLRLLVLILRVVAGEDHGQRGRAAGLVLTDVQRHVREQDFDVPLVGFLLEPPVEFAADVPLLDRLVRDDVALARDLHHVADANLVVQEDEEAADDVLDEMLGAEADSYTDHSGGRQDRPDLDVQFRQNHQSGHHNHRGADRVRNDRTERIGPLAVFLVHLPAAAEEGEDPRGGHPRQPHADEHEHQDHHDPGATADEPIHRLVQIRSEVDIHLSFSRLPSPPIHTGRRPPIIDGEESHRKYALK